MHRPIRIGILSDSLDLPSYLWRPLKRLVDQGKVEIAVVCLNQTPARATVRQKIPKVGRVAAEFLFRSLSRTKSQVRRHAISSLTGGVHVHPVTPIAKKFSHYFSDEDIHRIRSFECDFLLRNGFKILRGGVLNASRYGVLSFHHGDNLVNRGGPEMYWEFAERWDNSGVVLQILTEELDGGHVVDRGFGELVPWDYRLSHNSLSEIAASMLYRFLDQFHASWLKPTPWFEQVYDRRLYRSAPVHAGLAHAFGFLSYLAKTALRKVMFSHRWSIFIGRLESPVRRYREIAPPRGEYWADPFLVTVDDRHYIYFERYRYAEGRGRIGVVELDSQFNVVNDRHVDLGDTGHVSFPNVFKADNDLYMLPETSSRNEVAVYRCSRFPDEFEKIQVLLQGVSAVDSSVIYHQGKWWLFTTHATLGGKSSAELQLYYADNLLTAGWTRHPMSPVCLDIRRGRNAGQVFRIDDKLYRVGQDRTRCYGRRLAVYAIEELTDARYEERFVRYIEPAWRTRLNRCHTFNVCGDLAVLDASSDVLRPLV